MKILFLDYNRDCLPALLRTFELARWTASLGHSVVLFFCHEGFRQAAWFIEMLESVQTGDFSVSFSTSHINSPVSTASNGAEEQPKVSAWRLLRPVILAFRFIIPEIKKIVAFKPDVIVARPDQSFSFLITGYLFRIPVVLCTDGPIEEYAALYRYSPTWPVSLDLWRAKKAKAILYLNEICGNLWKQKGLSSERLFACANGVDPNVFKPLEQSHRARMRGKFGFKDNEIVLGFCGNQRFWHGLHLLIAAFTALRGRIGGLRCIVVGTLEHPRAAGVDTLPPDNENAIVFTGPIEYPHMPEFMDIIDIMVMPYPAYPLFHFSPMKMFESLSMAKIIVASSQGQIRELLADLPSAFLYDPQDGKGLESALCLANDAIRLNSRLGMQSRELITKGHTWKNRAQQVAASCEYALRGAVQRQKRRPA